MAPRFSWAWQDVPETVTLELHSPHVYGPAVGYFDDDFDRLWLPRVGPGCTCMVRHLAREMAAGRTEVVLADAGAAIGVRQRQKQQLIVQRLALFRVVGFRLPGTVTLLAALPHPFVREEAMA